ncbi:MAG: hypothetical protein SFU86_09310 [Pirellulaceae bacterium]|nr:hypothetical protein [Pirellulaceae bacterium]
MELNLDESAAGTLRIEFPRVGDRYAQVLSLVSANGQVMPLLESIEGSPADNWPASPPLQNLHLQDLPDGRRVALLVGMAGRSHWSASIETIPGQAALLFDIACRTSDPAATLGNRYRLLTAVESRLSFVALADALLHREGDRLTITPAQASGPAQKTIRWRYQVVLNQER